MTDEPQKREEPKIEVFLDLPQYEGASRQSALFNVYVHHFGTENVDGVMAVRAMHFAEYIIDHPDELKMHMDAIERFKKEFGSSS